MYVVDIDCQSFYYIKSSSQYFANQVLKMINKNYASQLRTCQRIKFDQALYILTMYEKKIRKNRTIQHNKTYDAENQMEDIIYPWKNKWKMDLTKPVLNCVTSVYPRILIDFSNCRGNQALMHYYHVLGTFIHRMRTEYEDETNYKFVLKKYSLETVVSGDPTTNYQKKVLKSHNFDQKFLSEEQYTNLREFESREKLLNCSKASVNSLLNIFYNLSNNLVTRFEENYEYVINEDIADVDLDSQQWQVIRPLRFVREILRRSLFQNEVFSEESSSPNMMEEESSKSKSSSVRHMDSLEQQSEQAEELSVFVHNVMKLMEDIKESEHGSTMISIQPQIKELTYVLHPLLAAVYATFKKENLEKIKDFSDWRSGVPIESDKFLENPRNSYNLSKIVLINLDGYESEFNLEFARNFQKHLMYISFPKEDSTLSDIQKVYSKRLLKKLMFRYTQALHQSFSTENFSEEIKTMVKLEELNYNPENYHYFAEQLYQSSSTTTKPTDDFNQNLFVFPIRFKHLKDSLPQAFSESGNSDIEPHESNFIRFIMRDFLINQIREFNASYVMISYSGRLTVENQHFVELVQDLTKVTNYKVILYPNLTTASCNEEMMQTEDRDGIPCDYDNFVNDPNIQSFLRLGAPRELWKEGCRDNSLGNSQMPLEQYGYLENRDDNDNMLEFFNKITRFLKVSSGTYNLTRAQEEEPMTSKFKNQFIMTYTDQLMTALGKEYYTVDRIRFKNKDLSIIPKLFEDNLLNIKKTFNRNVSEFYTDLYRILQAAVFNRLNSQKLALLMESYKMSIESYKDDIEDLWEKLNRSSHVEMSHGKDFGSDFSINVNSSSSLKKSEEKSTKFDVMSSKSDVMKQIQDLKTCKALQRFTALKELHFIQISSEKFEETVNIYVKRSLEQKEFASISEESEETHGLFDVSFIRKDKSQIKIFETTRILYKHDQQERERNHVPILIMNSLSDERPNYFENYIADLDIHEEVNKERKNIEEKKCLAVPIVFRDGSQRQRVSGGRSFVVRSDWNYHETQNYLILFWPVEFDFFKASVLKMINRPYYPRISEDIYMASKSKDRHVFTRIETNMGDNRVLPRMGCSCYEFEGKVFVFGGLYDRERNYLNFQHDITSLDLLEFQHNSQRLNVENLKGILYSDETFTQNIRNGLKYNSYIRPKMEFEIFNKSQLAEWHHENQHLKHVILFGGYGENFLRPFSILTNFYYELKFSYESRSIVSVEKRVIYDRTVPINIKEMTKNMGTIKTNKKNPNTSLLECNKITEPNSFLFFRSSFRLERTADDVEDFKYKFRFMFSDEEYKNFKPEIKRVQEQRTEEFDNSTITIEKVDGNNHMISLEKDGKRCLINLHVEIPHEKAKKLGCSREVKLSHGSVVHLDFWNSMICAIVKHDFYTKGKSVLVEYNIRSLENLSFNHDEIPHIALTWVKEFDADLSLHILIACNKNTIAILHGHQLLRSATLKEFIVKKRKNKAEVLVYEVQERPEIMTAEGQGLSNHFQRCYSVFFKQRNKIICFEYLSPQNSPLIVEIVSEIELNSSNDIYAWEHSNRYRDVEVEMNGNGQTVSGPLNNCHSTLYTLFRHSKNHTGETASLSKINFSEYFKILKEHQQQFQEDSKKLSMSTDRMVVLTINKQRYVLELGSQSNTTEINPNTQKYNVRPICLQVLPLSETPLNQKYSRDALQRGIILQKNIEDYNSFQRSL